MREDFIERFPSQTKALAETDKSGRVKIRVVEIPAGKESVAHLIGSTIGLSSTARMIGAAKSNLSSYLKGYTSLGRSKREKLDGVVKKLFTLKQNGRI